MLESMQGQLQIISKTLNLLSAQIDHFAAQLETQLPAEKAIEAKTSPQTKTRPKAAPGKTTRSRKPRRKKGQLETVLRAVKSAPEGITVAELKEQTKYSPKQLSNCLYKLKENGKILSPERGKYVSA